MVEEITKKDSIIAMFIACLWPFLHYYSYNYFIISLSEIYELLIFFVMTLVLFSLLSIVSSLVLTQKKFEKTFCFLVLFVYILFQYANLISLFDEHTKVIFPLLLIIFVFLSFLFGGKKMLSLIKVTITVPVITTIFICIGKATSSSSSQRIGDEFHESGSSGTVSLPNIYYILLDGYAGQKSLSKVLEFDNTQFIDSLKEKGFFVAKDSFANYPTSFMSISSSLDMNYHVKAGVRKDKTRSQFGTLLQGKNRSVKKFKDMGYQYVHFSNEHWKLSKCRFNYDICLPEVNMSDSNFSFSRELTKSIIQMTPFLDLYNKSLEKFDKKKAENGVKYLENWIKRSENKMPFYMFAHTLAAHSPFQYIENCRSRPFGLRKVEDANVGAYLNEINCINKDILSLVEAIEKRDPDGIIILQGDHGSATRSQFEKYPLKNWDDLDLLERYSILNAIKVPKRCRKSLYHRMSPVNTFRSIVNCISTKKLELLDDEYFYSQYEIVPGFELVEKIYRLDSM